MFVVCPHCRATYQVERVDEDVIFVCHRCHAEFGFGEPPEDAEPVEPPAGDKETLPLFDHARTSPADPGGEAEATAPETEPAASSGITEETAPADVASADDETGMESPAMPDEDDADNAMAESTEMPVFEAPDSGAEPGPEPIVPARETSPGPAKTAPESAETNTDETPPRPPRARVLPWLTGVLIIIAGLGFWTQRDAWLDDPGLRATLINLGVPLAIRDKDWHIPPGSVHAEWIKRNDGSQVLVIEGRVKNRLESDLPPPYIHVSVFDRTRPDHVLIERTLPITQPPLMVTIRRAPFLPPPEDALPVAPLGERGFVLVLEGLPESAGEFTLAPAARNRSL